jgi:hypothetical protein
MKTELLVLVFALLGWMMVVFSHLIPPYMEMKNHDSRKVDVVGWILSTCSMCFFISAALVLLLS